MSKLSFLLSASVGYVLGARAGRKRYEQIRSGANQLWRSQPVQSQVASAKHAATTKAAPAALGAVSTAASVASERMRAGASKVKSDPQRDVASAVTADSQGPATYPLGEGPTPA
ncbi:protoporphyrinogen oxidase [Janibacter limosus]|jgi:hypothetical protein|uniref:Protoporphyrinogen oxidase n=1 Tax=Janibacter limosus TaxID=53458 RepID=A0A4P6MPX5_9MICO|nr:protoporphyrinogen oxidase [Janibacter limosus]QBF44959.1 protoporphyrinogen oxidase [Janibacter limosus]